METTELYKIKTDLENKASQIWQTTVNAISDIHHDHDVLIFCLPNCSIVYCTKDHMSDIVFTNTFERVHIELDAMSDFDLALAVCLGLQQAQDNESKVLTNTKGYLLELTSEFWQQNRKLTIELPKHRPSNITAVMTITRPLDSDDGKSSALAYPLNQDEIRGIIEVLEGILENKGEQ